MAILTDISYGDLLDKLLVIHPCNPNCITGVGYDLRIGFYIIVNRKTRRIVDLGEITDGIDDFIVLDPDCYIVVASRELVYLSPRIAATFHSKSSLAAEGLFINSTSGDPRWDGRLIFLLYNASEDKVMIGTQQTIVTMVIHTVERRSRATPKQPQDVLAKYLEKLDDDQREDRRRAIHYLIRTDQTRMEYIRKRESVKRFTDRPFIIYYPSYLFYRIFWLRKGKWLVLVLLSIALFFLVVAVSNPTQLSELGVTRNTIGLLGSICSFITFILAILAWKRDRGQRE